MLKTAVCTFCVQCKAWTSSLNSLQKIENYEGASVIELFVLKILWNWKA